MHFNWLFLTKTYYKVCIEVQKISKPDTCQLQAGVHLVS